MILGWWEGWVASIPAIVLGPIASTIPRGIAGKNTLKKEEELTRPIEEYQPDVGDAMVDFKPADSDEFQNGGDTRTWVVQTSLKLR